MKTAKEMFEELGYEEYFNNDNMICYKKKDFISDTYEIEFNKKAKIIISDWYTDSPFTPVKALPIDMKELKAINQQVKELGWDEN